MSSRRRTFECFVHLYDVKYKITLPDVTEDYVLFGELYREIQKIDPRQDVSFETNTFEIYDKRHDRFQRITSFSQVIDDNSRVRVLIKPQLFKNYLSNTSDKRFDTINSYQTPDHYNGHSQSVGSNGSRFADYYNVYNKRDLQLNSDQTLSDHQFNARSTLAGQSMSSSVGALVSSSIGSVIEPSTSSLLSSRSSVSDWRPKSGYCPKVVEYDNHYSNFDRYSSDMSQTNNYDMKGYDNYNYNSDNSNQINITSIVNQLMETQNKLLKEKTLEELRKEGIEMKVNFNFETYFCKVCDDVFQTSEAALKHSRSIPHSENKLGIFADDLDRSLIIPTENLSDINVVLARKQELKKLDTKTKYEFRRHGIRIKDGIGVNAYVCLECKVSFMSYNYVKHHLEKFKTPENGSDVVYSSNTFYPGLLPSSEFKPMIQKRSSEKKSIKKLETRTESLKTSESRSKKRRRRKRNREIDLKDKDRVKGSTRDRSPEPKRERKEPKDEKFGLRDPPDLDIINLKNEGIKEKEFKNKGHKYVCQLCDRIFGTKALAVNHVASDEHIGNKTGEFLRGVERIFVVDCSQKGIDNFLTRKKLLKEISFNSMEQYVYHGVRLKNGLGSDAFICLTCNQSLADLQTIDHHIDFLDIHRNITMADMCDQSETAAQLAQLSPLDLEATFRNEGILHNVNKMSDNYMCVFCDTKFKKLESVITHLSRPYHRKTKRMEILRPIDALFVIPSNKSDDFEVAFARNEALFSLTNEQKIRYSEEGICLKDGFGSEAYCCLKCQLPIAADSHRTAAVNINKHIDSNQHIQRLSI